jgi:5-methylcytosine-specific restriction endonuclease McrBC GTP-binding regulatory subunit McrB
VAKEVYKDEEHPVRIPSNMYILATMNTADQNVFTLDTAFQRRWNMRQIENRFDKSEHSKDIIVGTKVNWGAFATVINDMVIDINVEMASSEDKRLGTYFAKKKELEENRFPEKVLKYLWDDAFKMDKTAIFNENCKSLEDVVITYETATTDKLAAVLRLSVYEKMLSKMQQNSTENNEN